MLPLTCLDKGGFVKHAKLGLAGFIARRVACSVRISVIGATALMLFGCANPGPITSPEFPALLSKAMPPEAGDVVIAGQAEWFPNTIGFNDLANFQMVEPTPAMVIVGSNALVFSQWDPKSHSYLVMKEVQYENMTEARVDTMGLSARVVVRASDFSYNTFDFVKGSGVLVDSEKSKQAGAFLASKVASKPLPKPTANDQGPGGAVPVF
jgi:hypothetical protein